MRTLLSLLTLCFLAACGSEPPAAPSGALFGEAFPEADALPTEAVLANPDAYLGKEITVAGRVAEVCQGNGCWLTLQTNGDNIRINVARTDDGAYAFTVPTDLSGRRVVVRGVLEAAEFTEAIAEHYAEDARRTEDDARDHDGDDHHNGDDQHDADHDEHHPMTELQMTAVGVRVEPASTEPKDA